MVSFSSHCNFNWNVCFGFEIYLDMGLFKLRKNKKFNYEPRYYKGDSNPFEMKHKFDDQRVTVQKINLKGTLKNALNDARHTDRATSRRIGFIIMVLVFIALWIIDFDLSLFFY